MSDLTAPTCYAYDALTGLYLGPVSANPSPLEPGVWLYPADSTQIAPPSASAGTAAVFANGAWSLVPDHRGETWYGANGPVIVRELGYPSSFVPPLISTPPPVPAPSAPDNPTLGDWRVGLVLWTRKDASGNTVNRLADVTAAVQALISAGNPLGAVAQQRLEYSNNVRRAELLQLKDVFAFTTADVDESLYRAQRVSLGDLSGVWPLPAQA